MAEEPTPPVVETGSQLTAAEKLRVKIQADIRTRIADGLQKEAIMKSNLEKSSFQVLGDTLRLLEDNANPFRLYLQRNSGDEEAEIRRGIPPEVPANTDVLVTDASNLLGEEPRDTLEAVSASLGDEDLGDRVAQAIKHPKDSGLLSLSLGEGIHLTIPVKETYHYDTQAKQGSLVKTLEYGLARAVCQMDELQSDGRLTPLARAMVENEVEKLAVSNKTETPS